MKPATLTALSQRASKCAFENLIVSFCIQLLVYRALSQRGQTSWAVNTCTLDEDIEGVSFDIPDSPFNLTYGLTQQEIDAGLDALHQAVLRKSLPFIVLIEDDHEDADLFRRALRRAGAKVEFMHFRSGRQAINFFSGNGCYADRERFPLPALTILDLNLIGMSGLAVLREIREKPQLESLAVVALTGSMDSCEIEAARSLSINGWVTKPDQVQELATIVRWLLQTWLPSAL